MILSFTSEGSQGQNDTSSPRMTRDIEYRNKKHYASLPCLPESEWTSYTDLSKTPNSVPDIWSGNLKKFIMIMICEPNIIWTFGLARWDFQPDWHKNVPEDRHFWPTLSYNEFLALYSTCPVNMQYTVLCGIRLLVVIQVLLILNKRSMGT